jgi:hypothetical protein
MNNSSIPFAGQSGEANASSAGVAFKTVGAIGSDLANNPTHHQHDSNPGNRSSISKKRTRCFCLKSDFLM